MAINRVVPKYMSDENPGRFDCVTCSALESRPSVKRRAISTSPVLGCSAIVRSAWAARGGAMGTASLADQDESDFERNSSLAIAGRSAFSSWFLVANLLLPKHVSPPRLFAPLPVSQICSPPSRAHQRFSAVARRIQGMPKTLWLALCDQTRLNCWSLLCL
jgi:hypothetical protein